jgi:uncharacterized spore protein YtfJ
MSMDVEAVLAQARDSMTVKRVFGEPIERDGVMVIPVANVMGGFGGGRGDQPGDGASGGGAGYGVRATPAGMYVIDHGRVRWEPALNLNTVILGGQITAIFLFLTIRGLVSALAERRATRPGGLRAWSSLAERAPHWMKPMAVLRR